MTGRISAAPAVLFLLLSGFAQADNARESGQAPASSSHFLGAFESLFDARLRYLQDLCEQGKFEEADSFYSANASDLDQNHSINAALAAIATGLNQRYGSDANALITQLNTATPTNPAGWPKIALALGQAHVLLNNYGRLHVVSRPELASPAISALSAAVTRTNALLRDGADKAFASYDQSNADFFSRYPLALDEDSKQKIVSGNIATWIAAVPGLDQAHATALMQAYLPLLRDNASRRAAAQAYEKAVIHANGWSEPLSIDKVWTLAANFQHVGLESRFMAERRAVLLLNGATPGPVPAGWDMDALTLGLPYVLSSRADMNTALTRLDKAGFHYILILDPSRSGQINALRDVVPHTGSRGTAGGQTGNPAYAQAKKALDDALLAYNQAMAAASLAPQDASRQAAMASARQRLNNARASFSQTPEIIRKGGSEDYTYVSATAERRLEQQVGIYYLDTRNKLLFRSRLDGSSVDTGTVYARLDANDTHRAELMQKTQAVLANFDQSLGDAAISASTVVPATLEKPVSGSRWQSDDLERLVNEDNVTFSHHLQEKIRQARAGNDDIAESLVLDMGRKQDEAGASDALPEDADCKSYAQNVDPDKIQTLWHSALSNVADMQGDSVHSSFSLMEAHEAIANLREDVARDASIDSALAALAGGAQNMDKLLTQPRKFVDADAVENAEGYYRQRLDNAAYNTVAARAGALRPDIVANMYRVYQYVYSERSHFDGVSNGEVFATADQMLQELGRQLVTADQQLSSKLNGDARNEALEAVNSTVNAHCSSKTVATSDKDAADKDTADKDDDDDTATPLAAGDQPADTASDDEKDTTDADTPADTAADQTADSDTAEPAATETASTSSSDDAESKDSAGMATNDDGGESGEEADAREAAAQTTQVASSAADAGTATH